MRPETWLPTCTVTSAESVPLAVTFPVILRFSTGAPLKTMSGSLFLARQRHYPYPAPARTSTVNTQGIHFWTLDMITTCTART